MPGGHRDGIDFLVNSDHPKRIQCRQIRKLEGTSVRNHKQILIIRIICIRNLKCTVLLIYTVSGHIRVFPRQIGDLRFHKPALLIFFPDTDNATRVKSRHRHPAAIFVKEPGSNRVIIHILLAGVQLC